MVWMCSGAMTFSISRLERTCAETEEVQRRVGKELACATQRRVGHHHRAHLRQLDEEDVARPLPVPAALHADGAQQPIGERDEEAQGDAGPEIDPAHRIGLHGSSVSHTTSAASARRPPSGGPGRRSDVYSRSTFPAEMPLPLAQVLQQIAGTRVLVIGDVIADEYLVGDSSRISSEAPVPVLQLHRRARHARRRGQHRRQRRQPWRRADADRAGRRRPRRARTSAARCERAGINFLPLRDGRATTRKVRVISQQQQLLRIDYEQATPIDRAHEQQLLDAVREPARGVRRRRGVRLRQGAAHQRRAAARSSGGRTRPAARWWSIRVRSTRRSTVVRLPDAELEGIAAAARRRRRRVQPERRAPRRHPGRAGASSRTCC